MKRLLLVFFGGGVGSGARYLLAGWVARVAGSALPYGTISVNAIGSFLIAAIMYLSLTANVIGPDLRLALTTGVMGGFTTYSTFNYESLSLFQQGAWLLGCLNIAVTLLLCLAAGAAGLLLARWLAVQPWLGFSPG
ncbi:MAG TPA: fluoride efflux transporter CrcB [Myxococcales bacterium]|nr:fluoride efflux transporter CrcB [Myxococcales bacterium]